jgi:hypothetical protein
MLFLEQKVPEGGHVIEISLCDWILHRYMHYGKSLGYSEKITDMRIANSF